MTQDKILEIIRKVVEDNVIDALAKEGFQEDEDKCYDNTPNEIDYESALVLLSECYFEIQK